MPTISADSLHMWHVCRLIDFGKRPWDLHNGPAAVFVLPPLNSIIHTFYLFLYSGNWLKHLMIRRQNTSIPDTFQ